MLSRRDSLLRAILIVVPTFAAYVPALMGGFVWDDVELYVVENPLVRAADGLWRFWFTTQPTDYYPLTNSLFWLEWRLWNGHPAGFHVVNVALHALGSLLLWRVLLRLAVPGAWFAALVYALHPVNVQTVAWISQSKNTLSGALFFASLLAYLHFMAGRGRRAYAAALGLFLLALLAKTSVIVLPLVLLGVVWWRHGKITRRDGLAVAPFFVLALALGALSLWFQDRVTGGFEVHGGNVGDRLATAGRAVWFYLGKALAPVGLAAVYPRWREGGADVRDYLPLVALVVVVLVGHRYRRRWGRPLVGGLGYYVAALLPVLGFADIGFMQHSFVSDHWQYLGLAGIIALATGLGAHLLRERARAGRLLPALVGLGIMAACFVLSWRQASVYRDEETLWRHVLAHNPGAAIALNNLGNVYVERGDLVTAARYYAQAVELDDRMAVSHSNLGGIFLRWNDLARAEVHLRRAAELRPQDGEAHADLGDLLARCRRWPEAAAELERAIRCRPEDAESPYRLGLVLEEMARPLEAAAAHRAALRLRPGWPEAERGLERALGGRIALSAP